MSISPNIWTLWPKVDTKLTSTGSMTMNLYLGTTARTTLKIRPCLPSAITFSKVVLAHIHLTILLRKTSGTWGWAWGE